MICYVVSWKKSFLSYFRGIYGPYNSTSTYIVMTLPQRETLTETQHFTYDTNSFIADFGGFLGLLLGFSFMDIYNFAIGFGIKGIQFISSCR
jgi:hypothetical protein